MNVAVDGLSAALDAVNSQAASAALKGITRAGDHLKQVLREQVAGAGLSDKLAKTWQDKIYDNKGTAQGPAALVYSKAPRIIDSYARGATIVATNGRRSLALPTDDTPKARGGKAMTPPEVEARFGRKLRFLAAKDAPGHGASTIGYLVLDDAVQGARGRVRLAGARSAKRVQSILMFTLVRAVKKPKLFDLPATAESVAATVPQLIAEEWGS